MIWVVLIKVAICLSTITFLFGSYTLAQSNLADQDFLDSSVQFSEEEGVRTHGAQSGSSSGVVYEGYPSELQSSPEFRVQHYDHPDLAPTAKKNGKAKPKKKKSMGFSFSDMAASSQKKDDSQNSVSKVTVVEKTQEKPSKGFGFSFQELANLSQKESTLNINLND